MTESETQDAAPGAPQSPELRAALTRYWRSNLRVMAALLTLWAFVSFGCSIVWADWLNQFNLPFTGFPLGFWFAQQGSIATFVICILIYCITMNRLDRRHHVELEVLASAARQRDSAGGARVPPTPASGSAAPRPTDTSGGA